MSTTPQPFGSAQRDELALVVEVTVTSATGTGAHAAEAFRHQTIQPGKVAS